MKKHILWLMFLVCMLSLAHADITPPLSPDGTPIVINTLMPYGEGLLVHYTHGETIFLSNAADEWTTYPIRHADPAARDAAIARRIAAMEALEMDTLLTGSDHCLFAAGEELLAVNPYTGALYRVTFEDGMAVMTLLTLLDVLPEKPTEGYLNIPCIFADEDTLYLLAHIKTTDAVADVVASDTLYAFDLTDWSRRIIPADLPDASYISYAAPWQDGLFLLDTSTRSTFDPAGLYLLDPAAGQTRTLQSHLGLFSLPQAGVLASDASAGVVILRALTDDLLCSVSAGEGVVPFARMRDYSEQLVFHPDGRVLRMNKTYAEAVDPLQAMPITQLNVLTGIHSAPGIGLNSGIPDIQLITHERFAAGEDEVAVFANAMTTQSGQFDVFLLPIMQAESIIRKGYCVPMVSESAQSLVAEMHPHMAKQLTNENGDLVMVPVQLLRRKTIAYDMRAAELLGIDPAELPSTYGELFEFMRDFESDYGDLALAHDISLFETSTARSIGILRQRMAEDAVALARADSRALQSIIKELGALLDDSLALAREVSDVVAPYFYVPQIMSSGSWEVPAHLDEPAFLFTLNTSALPSDHSEAHKPYRYLLFTQPFELALSEDVSPIAVYSGYAMVVNPYSEKQEAALRYMDYVLRHLDGSMAANLLTTAQPVESWFMQTYHDRKALLERRLASGDTGDAALMEHLRDYVAFEPFIYDVTQTMLDTYHDSVALTHPVWLDMKEAFAPCSAAWEQFLRGSIGAEQFLRRVLEVSRMIGLE